jgi:hypothetical protein
MAATKPIALFYNGLFVLGDPPRHLPNAGCIVSNQITQMINSGLWDAATKIYFGINGGNESVPIAKSIIPAKAKITYHGLKNRNENATIMQLWEGAKTHPGWNVLYLHAKGASHDPQSDYGRSSAAWREGMMQDLVVNWRQCVADLEKGYDIVCSHWMWNMADGSQHIPAGNFLWVTSDFVAKLPSMLLRERIKQDGLGALASRYEAEVFWGNGPRPNVLSYRPNGGGGVP